MIYTWEHIQTAEYVNKNFSIIQEKQQQKKRHQKNQTKKREKFSLNFSPYAQQV